MKCVLIINLNFVLILISRSVYALERSYIYDFPPLYKFDNYDACLSKKHDNTTPIYATVFAEIKPNISSNMWQQIWHHYEEYPFRYRHDRLFFGVCLERCKNLMKSSENYQLIDEDLVKNEITDYFVRVHKRPLDIQCREEYHDLIHNCLNQEFHQKYDLNLKTFIEYCEESKYVEKQEKEKINKDSLESLMYAIIALIVILNILSTIYDFALKMKQPLEQRTNEFYKISPQTSVSKLLTSFSICRNYYRLIQPNYAYTVKDFQFLNGFRSVCMLLCLYGHTYVCKYQHIANPQHFEKEENEQYQLWMLNGSVILEIFFTMSGLLLFFKIQQGHYVTPQTEWTKILKSYLKLMVFRYLRFAPTVALLTLYNATIMSGLQDGPFWRHISEPSRVFSRERGWRNLLMINNFSIKESASVHTWYLAVDWQLSLIYTLIIMIVLKYPKYKKRIYSFLAILSFILPFSISYIQKLEPSFIIKPESNRYSFFHNIDVYYKIYTKFYTNLFGYLFGIICAEIYLKYTSTQKVRKFINERPHYIAALYFLPIIAGLILYLGVVLNVREPSLLTALYAGLHRKLWAILICGPCILVMSCNCGWIAYEFCCLPIFRILARLSFQVYIWHMTIIFMINGYQRQPYYINTFVFFTQFFTTYFTSTILAFFMVLFVEYPIAQCILILQKLKIKKLVQKSL